MSNYYGGPYQVLNSTYGAHKYTHSSLFFRKGEGEDAYNMSMAAGNKRLNSGEADGRQSRLQSHTKACLPHFSRNIVSLSLSLSLSIERVFGPTEQGRV